jgi:hypothetical protein
MMTSGERVGVTFATHANRTPRRASESRRRSSGMSGECGPGREPSALAVEVLHTAPALLARDR